MRLTFASARRLGRRVFTPGPLALAAFGLCVASGLPLLVFYRPGAPVASLARMLMLDPAGTWLRAVHFWAAQGFLAGAALYLIARLVGGDEKRRPFGAWLRLVLTGPVILLALLSGFILRGDDAAVRTAGVLAGLLQAVPAGGRLLSLALFGTGSGLPVVFWHHVATLSIGLGVLLFVVSRRRPPPAAIWAIAAAAVAAAATLWVPSLGAYAAGTPYGPWYFAGVTAMLLLVPDPGWVAGIALCVLLGLAALPLVGDRLRPALKWILAATGCAYAVFVIAASTLRAPTGERMVEPRMLSYRAWRPAPPRLATTPVSLIGDRPEGCLSCHREMAGFSPVHNPAAIGCSACHRGNPFTLDATLAHAGMTLTPGNLSVVRQTCATAGCHADIADRVPGALMNTMSGVVAVDKVVFGESARLNRRYAVASLGHSPADRHLRTLCASCHLGQEKLLPAAIGQQSRGGGCSACHLDYGADSLGELRRRADAARTGIAPRQHPGISTRVPAAACFGCHSRSGRISTNYDGWHETSLTPAAARRQFGWPREFRVLDDGRVFTREAADVHHEKGMICTDCHLASEVMGDGTAHAHEADAVKIACADCHAGHPPTAVFTALDPETQRIVALRQLNAAGRRFVRAGSGGVSYPNTFLDESGAVTVATAAGTLLHPRPPAAACSRAIPAHAKLECRACHSAWAPQCIDCHTSFDPRAEGWDHLAGRPVRGAWQETGADYRADPPVLGVTLVQSRDGAPTERIGIFVPGMILTLNRTDGAVDSRDEFHRLYAPAAPHTTVTHGRNCVSCHADSLALGYGRGTLNYEIRDGRGHWTFTPALPRSPYDGLPADAWIGFLEEPATPAATRTNVRPLNRAEQQRLLLVGACLQCHPANESRLAAVFADFDHYRDRLSPRCVLPDWVR